MSNVSKTSNMLSLVTFRCSLEDGMTALAAYLSVSRYQVKPCPERASPAKPFTPSIISYKLKAFLRLSFQEHIRCSSWPRYIFQEPLHLLRQKCLKQNPGKGWTTTDQNYHKLSSNYRSRRQLEAVYAFKIGWHARAWHVVMTCTSRLTKWRGLGDFDFRLREIIQVPLVWHNWGWG